MCEGPGWVLGESGLGKAGWGWEGNQSGHRPQRAQTSYLPVSCPQQSRMKKRRFLGTRNSWGSCLLSTGPQRRPSSATCTGESQGRYSFFISSLPPLPPNAPSWPIPSMELEATRQGSGAPLPPHWKGFPLFSPLGPRTIWALSLQSFCGSLSGGLFLMFLRILGEGDLRGLSD